MKENNPNSDGPMGKISQTIKRRLDGPFTILNTEGNSAVDGSASVVNEKILRPGVIVQIGVPQNA